MFNILTVFANVNQYMNFAFHISFALIAFSPLPCLTNSSKTPLSFTQQYY
jgi:hypothetical protein